MLCSERRCSFLTKNWVALSREKPPERISLHFESSCTKLYDTAIHNDFLNKALSDAEVDELVIEGSNWLS